MTLRGTVKKGKGAVNVAIVVNPESPAPTAGAAPRMPLPPAPRAMPAGGPPMSPPGVGGPPAPMMAGPGGPPPGMPPRPMGMKKGGRTKMTAGACTGEGRLQKGEMYGAAKGKK